MSINLELPKSAQLEDVKINWDLTPKEAYELLPTSDAGILSWPEAAMNSWNAGKHGTENVNLPIVFDHQLKKESGRLSPPWYFKNIGFALPVVIASLALPENEPERVRGLFTGADIWALMAWPENDEDTLCLNGEKQTFGYYLGKSGFRLLLVPSDFRWGYESAFVGAPQPLV